jgi:hypothetical protein
VVKLFFSRLTLYGGYICFGYSLAYFSKISPRNKSEQYFYESILNSKFESSFFAAIMIVGLLFIIVSLEFNDV